MDKVKLIARIMNRLIYGLNRDNGGDAHIRGGTDQPEDGTAAATLTRFINVVRDNNPNKANQLPLKEKVSNIFFRANEIS